MQKRCFKCKKIKPIDEFYTHSQMADGHLNKCKKCTKTYEKIRRRTPGMRERILKYDVERAKRPERKKQALEYQRNRRRNYPGKDRARNAVSNALRDGRIVRGPCEVCGGKAQAHHEDYRRPLHVRWLCFKHHREEAHGQIVG